MSGFRASLRKEWLEQWRGYRVLVVFVVLILFGLISPLTARYGPELMKLLPNGEAIARMLPAPTVADAVAQYLKNVSQLGIVIAILLTMGVVAQEKDRGTAAMVLVKPLSRRAFLLAKVTVLGLMFGAAVLAAGIAAWYYTWLLFEPLPFGGWLALNGLVIGFVLVHVAVTFFFSVAARSQAAAGGLAFGLLLLLALAGTLPVVGTWFPAQLVSWGATLLGTPAPPPWPAFAVTAGIVIAAIAGAVVLFERQEL